MTHALYEGKTVYESLVKNADYALANLSRDLVYEVYGMAQMAYKLGGITKNEFYALNDKLIRDGLNNYRNVKLR